MKKNIIRLTESELKAFIKEAVHNIISEASNNRWDSYMTIDIGDIDCDDELEEFFDNLEECPDTVEVGIDYEIIPYDRGDYYTPPSGGEAELTDYELDVYNTFKDILPEDLYQRFLGYVDKAFSNQIDDYLMEIYDDYENYEPEYERDYYDD
jgi:hypothetical protein